MEIEYSSPAASTSVDNLLNTPIKKIQNLTIHSPLSSLKFTSQYSKSPSGLYPNLQDMFDAKSINDKENAYPKNDISSKLHSEQSDIKSAMIDKGYSQKITNAVLDELTMRSSEISQLINSKSSVTGMAGTSSITASQEEKEKRRKRFSLVHKSRFNRMESISNHYSLPRIISNKSLDIKPDDPANPSFYRSTQESYNFDIDDDEDQDMANKRLSTTTIGSVSKRRRTLNGPEEVLPELTTQTQSTHSTNRISPLKSTMSSNIPSSPFKNAHSSVVQSPFSFSANLSPFKSNIPTLASSSPSKGISPSKKSYNLNLLLQDAPQLSHNQQQQQHDSFARPQKPPQAIDSTNHKFLKPHPPSLKNRPSSLELAGVKPNASRKPSLNNLKEGPSLSHKSSKSSLIPRMPSNSNLQKKPLNVSLSKTSSIPHLQKKPSSTFNKPQPTTGDYHNLNQRPPELASPVRSTSLHSLSSSHKSVTKPQPFSFYNKPTISSSQKSLNGNQYPLSQSSFTSSKSMHSLTTSNNNNNNNKIPTNIPDKSASLSQRSLYKYQQFKKRFH
ncbi:uncharacterized protein KQ657_000814 [Scheffersomyces spartinae]|uniref:Uncharacterized protein n=1 Tax=Scheffersomyces spartinae TaxID=45513 RepID=A0A9P8AIR3_9ASCO|nr:uncharacterized protein KQ657_000814 [Scheffersomyces spartinae]KAG7193396.1 hypothetical protein KQ657_000814 [Scheffersomyces spartinae]